MRGKLLVKAAAIRYAVDAAARGHAGCKAWVDGHTLAELVQAIEPPPRRPRRRRKAKTRPKTK